MHAFLIVGGTESERERFAREFLGKRKIKQVLELPLSGSGIYTISSVRQMVGSFIVAPLDKQIGRAVLVLEANRLTGASANAFLKTLEEPLGKTILVLTAPAREAVLETVSSRCEVVDIGKSSLEISSEELEQTKMLWKELSSCGLGERLAMVDSFGSRDKAIENVRRLLFLGHKYFLEAGGEEGSVSDLARLLELLDKTRLDLEQNVNVKLAIGELLIRWK